MGIRKKTVSASLSEPRKLRNLSRHLVAGLLSIAVIASGLVVVMNYVVAASKAEKALAGEADQFLDYLSRSLELPVWSMDNSTVLQIGDAFMTSDQFALLEATSFNGEKHQPIYSNRKPGQEEMVQRYTEIRHIDQVIGSVRIGLSRIPYQNELQRQLHSSLLIILVMVLAMVVACWAMLRSFVYKPLRLLMRVASQMADGDYDSRTQEIRFREFAMVYAQLTAMAENVKNREASLENANSRLQKEIARREDTERELRGLRNYLSNIIDSMPSLLIGVDADGRVTQWNRTAERNTGIDAAEAQGRAVADLIPWMASEKKKIADSIRTRQIIRERKKSHPVNEGVCYEDVIVYPLVASGVKGAVIRIDDVTEKVRMEEMMIQNEKLLSVGGLAAGMAHEINNPLAGMMQTAAVMDDRLTDMTLPANLKAAAKAGTTLETISVYMESRGIIRMLGRIRESGKRAGEIVANMLSFARKGDSAFSSHHLAELLDQTLDLAGSDYDLKKNFDFRQIEIVREYDRNLPPVPCEAGKIQQVLLNLLRNGAEAMQEVSETDKGSPHRFILRLADEPETKRVRIEIEDNGPGMDEETRKRVFEPFFTTKPTDRGTGLGLSVSYFIVTENHGGTMQVVSKPGKGTTFAIELPTESKGTRL